MKAPVLKTEDWLDLALNELKEHGYTALRALSLAKKLKVTRGSFYHHFESLEAFHRAVITHWARQSSGGVIRAAQETEDAAQALEALLQTTLRSGEALERAVRSWATVEPLVAKEVAQIDATRIQAAEDLLLRAGVSPAEAAARARMLYWAAIGRLMLPFPEQQVLADNDIAQLATLMRHR